ncbi:MAG TPA: cupredoxin domain-containing protein [Gaiellaceae bacterium]|nr:cupredoxin domain-containing protein [Gaiellaceae bacterium]
MKARAVVAISALVASLVAVSLATAAEESASTPAGVAAESQVVTVSMYEMGFKLSASRVQTGTVTFRVVNDGKVVHDFRINGKGTPVLGPGEQATLTVDFPQPGTFSFVCTVEGHAAAGMVGKLVVASTAERTQVSVSITAKGFKLSKNAVPAGVVVFRVVNKAKVKHGFRILGKKTPLLKPRKKATLTVDLSKPGTFAYGCPIKRHRAAGMVGKLIVK